MTHARPKRTGFYIAISIAAVLHLMVLFVVVFHSKAVQKAEDETKTLSLSDVEEIKPPEPKAPPPPVPIKPRPRPHKPPPPKNVVEKVAENMVATEKKPTQTVVDTGTLEGGGDAGSGGPDEYHDMTRDITRPKFDTRALLRRLIYPAIAKRSGVEGRVILELLIDRNGKVQKITVRSETPPGYGFAEAAEAVFTGMECTPAKLNGENVAVRYRYPLRFRLR
jgi:protein TonB